MPASASVGVAKSNRIQENLTIQEMCFDCVAKFVLPELSVSLQNFGSLHVETSNTKRYAAHQAWHFICAAGAWQGD